jgi:hypothetical protein
MTIEKEWTQEEIDNAYRQLQVNRLVTEQDLLCFYDILFQTSNSKHYETWLSKANRLYEEQSENLELYQNITLLLLIGKVESLLEKIYAS